MQKPGNDLIGEGFVPPAPQPRKNPDQNFVWLRSAAILPAVINNPIDSFSANAYERPVFQTRLFNQPVTLVHDPELLRHIFVENANILIANPIRQKILKPALREGMLTAEGDVWRKARKAIAPVFVPRNVNAMAGEMKTVTEAYIERLKQGPKDVLLADEMTRLAYLVLSNSLFSGDLDENSERVIGDVAYFLKHLSRPDPIDFLGAPDWIPRLTKLRGTGALKRLRSAVRKVSKQRMARMQADDTLPEDFLTLLLRSRTSENMPLTLDEIEDNIITFIAAGHETTARALAWTFYLLAFDAEALKRCQDEADALDVETVAPADWGDHLPWATACFEESMRLFPPAGIISRNLAGDIDFNDTQIDAGNQIIASPWILHRHECLWERPRQFHPNRFFAENRNKIDRFAYLPFGLGQRVCIGSRFAMQEALIIMALLLRSFRFEYRSDKMPWPVMKVTVQPDNGIPIRLMPR